MTETEKLQALARISAALGESARVMQNMVACLHGVNVSVCMGREDLKMQLEPLEELTNELERHMVEAAELISELPE
jgi:hypothetical protein